MKRNTMKKIMPLVLVTIMLITMIPIFPVAQKVVAAQTFEIISPENNALIGAGHFDIRWTSATESALEAYKLYVDGQLVAKTDSTSYEYYTTEVKKHSAYVVAEYSDGTRLKTEKTIFGVTKKGLCANEEMARYLKPVDMNIGWYYNWAAYPHSYEAYQKVEYVPMIWGISSEDSISYVANAGYKHLLAYNEPDMGGEVGGSTIDVNTAISHWNNFLGNDYYLGSPAPALSPSWDNGVWFRTFMNGINQDTVDFVALHCYYWQYAGREGAETFLREVVDKTYEMYHKPIWITEFAIRGWAYNDMAHIESVKEFMRTAIDGLNARPYVERYAWFSFNTTDAECGISSLYHYQTGNLTDLGRLYVEYGNPEELAYSGEETAIGPEINDKVKIEGYQISTVLGGSRVIGSVEPEINGKRVAKWGLVYALGNSGGIDFPVSSSDMYVNSDNEYVATLESGDLGKSESALGNSNTATYFIRTVLFAASTEREFNTKYKVRAYAQLDDGSYVYSKIFTYSIYNVSDYLYKNRKASNYPAHAYLYQKILKVVNPFYTKIDFNWSEILAK